MVSRKQMEYVKTIRDLISKTKNREKRRWHQRKTHLFVHCLDLVKKRYSGEIAMIRRDRMRVEGGYPFSRLTRVAIHNYLTGSLCLPCRWFVTNHLLIFRFSLFLSYRSIVRIENRYICLQQRIKNEKAQRGVASSSLVWFVIARQD